MTSEQRDHYEFCAAKFHHLDPLASWLSCIMPETPKIIYDILFVILECVLIYVCNVLFWYHTVLTLFDVFNGGEIV